MGDVTGLNQFFEGEGEERKNFSAFEFQAIQNILGKVRDMDMALWKGHQPLQEEGLGLYGYCFLSIGHPVYQIYDCYIIKLNNGYKVINNGECVLQTDSFIEITQHLEEVIDQVQNRPSNVVSLPFGNNAPAPAG